MRITLERALYERMLAHARAVSPREACGLIAGVCEGEGSGECRHITEVYLLTNADDSEEHFTLKPEEQLKAVRDMRARSLTPLGNWHSHPASPARPSQEDIRLAYDRGATYCILSLADPASPVLKAFSIADGKAHEEELLLV